MPEPKEKLVQIPYPIQGIDVSIGEFDQRSLTSAEAINVRAVDALAQRLRGGSRPGISRYIDERVNGVAAIQHLATIVSTSGEALGWVDTGGDFGGDPGDLGIDYGPAGPAANEGTAGGGGFQPSGSFQDDYYQSQVYRITLVASSSTGPANGSTTRTLTATIISPDDGQGHGFIGVTLSTSPSGRDGDGDGATTQFSLAQPPLGDAVFTVHNNRAERVSYVAYAQPVANRSINSRAVTIRWKPYKLTASASSISAAANDTILLTSTLVDESNRPVPGKIIRLTATGSSTGNGDTAVTNASGVATFTVTDAIEEVVTYTFTELSEEVDAEEGEIVVTYGIGKLVQYAYNNDYQFGTTVFSNGLSVTFDDPVTSGSLLVLLLSFGNVPGEAIPVPSSVTDSLGNTYTLATSINFSSDSDPGEDYSAAIYYSANCLGGSSSVVVTGHGMTTNLYMVMELAEYRGILAASPLHSTSSQAGTSGTITTGSITINSSGDLLVAHCMSEWGQATLSNSNFTLLDYYDMGGLSEIQTAAWEAATTNDECTWANQVSPTYNWIAIGACFKHA